MNTAPTTRAIDPAAPGSAAAMFGVYPGRKHPAEVVLAALLRGRAVDLPDGHAYFLDTGLTLGRVGATPGGRIPTEDLTLGEFLRLCADLSFNDLFLIGCDTALAEDAEERHRERSRLRAAQAAPRSAHHLNPVPGDRERHAVHEPAHGAPAAT